MFSVKTDADTYIAKTVIIASGKRSRELNVPEKQIIIAAGEGAKAALGVFRYLAGKK